MISADQFTLADDMLIAFSSRADGTMLDRTREFHAPDVVENRRVFCEQAGIVYDDVVYQLIQYDDVQTYERIVEVGQGDTTKYSASVHADGLFTRERGVGLFLPVADCIATVLYDPIHHYLALLHMGRHSTLSNLLSHMITKFTREGSSPADIRVFMSPSATRTSYRLEFFDHTDDLSWQDFYDKKSDGYYIDMQGYNRAVCLEHGVKSDHIKISPIDTVNDSQYFSHFAGDTTGRGALLTLMT